MDPNNNQPQTPNTPNQAPAMPEQPNPMQAPEMPPMQPQANKSKTVLIVLILIVALAAIGTGAWFVLKANNDSPANNTSTTSGTDTNDEGSDQVSGNQDEATIVTSITTTDSPNNDNGTISFTHPAEWKVTKTPGYYNSEDVTIESAMGNTVTMSIADGVGGDCGGPNTTTYTLVKKLTTQSPDYVFTEYNAPSFPTEARFQLEHYSSYMTDAHKALTDGQSGTDTCTNLSSYPIAKNYFIHIYTPSGQEASYADIENDTEFIAMLQSFKVVDS